MNTLKTLIILGIIINSGMEVSAREFRVGFFAGSVFTNARVINKPEAYSDSQVFYPMYSFNINGYFEYNFSENWGISAEPGFIRKGGIVRFGHNHYMSPITLSLNYIQVPLFTNFHISKKFCVSIGPEFAFLINKENNLPEVATGFSNFYDNALEISGVAGFTYGVSRKIDLGLRYGHGLTYNSLLIWTDLRGPPIGQSKVYNQYVQFIIRYNI